MSYKWEWNPAVDGDGIEEWQPCSAKGFSGTESSTLIISNVQKLNEGSYHSIVSNYAGSKISKPAKLSVGKNVNTAKFMYNKHPHSNSNNRMHYSVLLPHFAFCFILCS